MEYFIAFTGGALWFIIYLIRENNKQKHQIKQLKTKPPKQDKIKQAQRERLIKQLLPLVNNNREEAERLADTPPDETITINKRG